MADWVRYEEVEGCSCDPDSVPAEREVLERGTMAGLYAAPGSFPARARVTIEHGGLTTEAIVSDDGSLVAYVSNGEGHDLRGESVAVHIAGGATYVVPLDRFDEVALVATGDDPRFPADAIAIEDPIGTIEVRATLHPIWQATPIEAFAISRAAPLVWGGWIAPTPTYGDAVVWTGPGIEGDPIGFVALHESGAASGCYAGSLGSCHCSQANREAHQCRFELVAEPPDAGAPDAGPHDAGTPDDASPF